jgi:transcriptional regulator GlxA family with amidase domain
MNSDQADRTAINSWAPVGANAAQILRVGILLWPSFPLMSFTGIVESLRHAGDHGDDSAPRYARWDVIGPAGAMTRSSCGVPISTTTDYISPLAFDHLFVIGGLLRDLDTAPKRNMDYIQMAYRAGIPIHGICTGSFILARAGLLDGTSACIHPYHREHFETAFPGHRFVNDRDFQSTGKVSTVIGGISILSLMKHLIAQHLGPDRGAKVHHQMTLPTADGLEPGSVASDHSAIDDPRIQRALVILDARSAQPPSIAKLSRMLGLSERQFLRLFRAHVGCAPQDYLIETKLRAAVWMLRHTRRSITAVAYAAGFTSGANLADHCRRRLNQSPREIRAAARVAD